MACGLDQACWTAPSSLWNFWKIREFGEGASVGQGLLQNWGLEIPLDHDHWWQVGKRRQCWHSPACHTATWACCHLAQWYSQTASWLVVAGPPATSACVSAAMAGDYLACCHLDHSHLPCYWCLLFWACHLIHDKLCGPDLALGMGLVRRSWFGC